MPVWSFSAPTSVPELWQTCVCGTNSAISWWSRGLLPRPPLPFPREIQVPVSPGDIPSPQQALALQLPTCKTPAVMAAFARHSMDNPGCLFLHHVLARSAGQGCSRSRKSSPKAQPTLSILCHLLTHFSSSQAPASPFYPPGKKRPSL